MSTLTPLGPAVSALHLNVREIAHADPVSLIAALAGDGPVALLESASADPESRWSFLCADPFQVMTSRDGRVEIDGRAVGDDPFAVLRGELERLALPFAPGLPPFVGGAVGYLGYELARHLERVPAAPADDLGLPDLALLFCDVVVAIDRRGQRALVLSSGLPESAPEARAARARARADAIEERLRRASAVGAPPVPALAHAPVIDSSFSRPGYERAVQRAIDYVLAGDVFQVNLAQRFEATLPEPLSPLDLYRRLRARNPAPFAAFLRLDDIALVSSSPERFLRLSGRSVDTHPIKGTRPRGATPAEDAAAAAALLASEKDRAENVMIVDLLRNDLSRVCRDRSVRVPELCALRSFPSVHHLCSTVTGELRPGVSALELLAAAFPGGSITGAPKVRAMEIIAELEPVRRGPFCGSIGYLGFDGALDTSIAIRTFVLRGRRATFHAGGGVVADSRPADEYDETLAKARALTDALGA